MSILQVKYQYEADLIFPRCRKSRILTVNDTMYVDIPEYEGGEKVCAFSTNFLLRALQSDRLAFTPYINVNGTPYEPYYRASQTPDMASGQKRDQILSMVEQLLWNESYRSDMSKTVGIVKGMSVEQFQSVLDTEKRFSLKNHCDGIDEEYSEDILDTVKKVNSDNKEQKRAEVKYFMENMFMFINSELYMKSRGPVLGNGTSPVLHYSSYLPLLLPIQTDNSTLINNILSEPDAHGRLTPPEQMTTTDRMGQYKALTASTSGRENVLWCHVVDMDVIVDNNQDFQGRMLFNLTFGEYAGKLFSDRYYSLHNKNASETPIDNLSDYLSKVVFQDKQHGEYLEKLYKKAVNGYQYDDVVALKDVFCEVYSEKKNPVVDNIRKITQGYSLYFQSKDLDYAMYNTIINNNVLLEHTDCDLNQEITP